MVRVFFGQGNPKKGVGGIKERTEPEVEMYLLMECWSWALHGKLVKGGALSSTSLSF